MELIKWSFWLKKFLPITKLQKFSYPVRKNRIDYYTIFNPGAKLLHTCNFTELKQIETHQKHELETTSNPQHIKGNTMNKRTMRFTIKFHQRARAPSKEFFMFFKKLIPQKFVLFQIKRDHFKIQIETVMSSSCNNKRQIHGI